MSEYRVTVHLSNDFRRTSFRLTLAEYGTAALDGVYDGMGFTLTVDASNHLAAAEMVYTICNSYPGELFCSSQFSEIVARYRAAGNRSLSVGDMLVIERAETWSAGPETTDGRYICMGTGFRQLI